MTLFELGRLLHSTVGIVALISFWIAALARKGGPLHRRAGKVYLPSMIVIMVLSVLMVAGKASEGTTGIAIFLAFLISIVGTASWLMWVPIQRRRSGGRIDGPTYRVLATWLILAGSALFLMGVAMNRYLIMFLSLLGVGFGTNMWRLALSRERGPKWWLEHHMNGAMLNFIATHDSFLALGLGSVIPELRHGWPRMAVAIGVTAIGLILRALSGARYGPARVRDTAVAAVAAGRHHYARSSNTVTSGRTLKRTRVRCPRPRLM